MNTESKGNKWTLLFPFRILDVFEKFGYFIQPMYFPAYFGGRIPNSLFSLTISLTSHFRKLVAGFASLLVCAQLFAAPPPQILDPAEWVDPGVYEGPDPYKYMAQPSKDGLIALTPNNGNFFRTFIGMEQGPVLENDDPFTYMSLEYLTKRFDLPGTASWNLWFPKSGTVTATFYLTVPESDDGYEWTIRFGDQVQTLRTVASDSNTPQPQTLTFDVSEPREMSFVIDCTENPPAPNTHIHRINLTGSAIPDAMIIRNFRRCYAKHVGFKAPEGCVGTTTWVFETEQLSRYGMSYSPISTPFGYFGLVFDHDGKIAPGSSFNFSMWVAASKTPEAPPNDELPRLLATALPDAEFGFFGTEGNGIKLRGAVAYPNGADRTIQALRIDYSDRFYTYYGYFYDESQKNWRLFAAGQKKAKDHWPEPDEVKGLVPRTGSFVEVPGPANTQRTGDRVRIVKRRGWFLDREGVPHRAVLETPPHLVPDYDYTAEEIAAILPKFDEYSERRAYYMDDFAEEGWIATQMGGYRRYWWAEDVRRSLTPPQGTPDPLPEYLQPDKLKQLFELPYEIGTPTAEASADRASITYPVKGDPGTREAILYYGTRDSLTFVAQDVGGVHAEPAIRDLFSPRRAWHQQVEPVSYADGTYRFDIPDLKPDTTYYYRLYLQGEDGKCWDFETRTFTTK